MPLVKISENRMKNGPKNLKNVSSENLGKNKARIPSSGKIPMFVICCKTSEFPECLGMTCLPSVHENSTRYVALCFEVIQL